MRMKMKISSKRIISFILFLLLILSTIFNNTNIVFAGRFGNGSGGATVSVSGSNKSGANRSRLGGGYLVSIVKYNTKKDNNADKAIDKDRDWLGKAYKDAILVYNSRHNIPSKVKVLVNINIDSAGNVESAKTGNKITSNFTGYEVEAIEASTTKAKNLLGFKSDFGKVIGGDYNFVYENDLNSSFGKNKPRYDLSDDNDRKKWFEKVEDIFGSNCTLGGVTKEQWVENNPGDDCIYCLLIVPVFLIADDDSTSSYKYLACYPSKYVADKISYLNPNCMESGGSFGSTRDRLDIIKGSNKAGSYIFKGYVPYGAWVSPKSKNVLGVNLSGVIDINNIESNGIQFGLTRLQCSIVGEGSSPSYVDNPFEDTSELSSEKHKNIKYIYQSTLTPHNLHGAFHPYNDRILGSGNELDNINYKNLTLVGKENNWYNDCDLYESIITTVSAQKPVLYSLSSKKYSYAISNLLDYVGSTTSVTTKVKAVSSTGNLCAGSYNDIQVFNGGGAESDYKQTLDKLHDSLDAISNGYSTINQNLRSNDVNTTNIAAKIMQVSEALSSSLDDTVRTAAIRALLGASRNPLVYDSFSKSVLDAMQSSKNGNKYKVSADARVKKNVMNVNPTTVSGRCFTNALTLSDDFIDFVPDSGAGVNSSLTDVASSSETKKFGYSSQIYIKAPRVKSFIKAYDVKVDADGNYITYSDAGYYSTKEYNISSSVNSKFSEKIGNFDTQNGKKELKDVYYVFVPNMSRYGKSLNFNPIQDLSDPSKFESWKSVLSVEPTNVLVTNTESSIVYKSNGYMGSSMYDAGRLSDLSGLEVDFKIGCYTHAGSSFQGFTCYVVRVYEEVDVVEKANLESTLELQDYELSHVYNTLYSGNDIKTTNQCSQTLNYTVTCVHYLGRHTLYYYKDDYRRYVWLNTEKKSGNVSVSSKYGHTGDRWLTYSRLPYYDKDLLNTFTEDTKIFRQNQLVDETLLLTRDIGDGDSVLPSSISKQKNQTVDLFLHDVLKMTPSNKPKEQVRGSVIRDSNYKLTKARDLFKFRGGWYESPNPPERSKSWDRRSPASSCGGEYLVESSHLTLRTGNNVMNKVDLSLNEIVHKYLTDTISNGKNLEKVIQNKSIEAPDSGSVAGVLQKKYAFPMIKNNKLYSGNSETTNPVVTNFYSEVEMIAEIPTLRKGYSRDYMEKYKVWMMSEKLRKVENSSLYFVSAESHNDDAIDRANTKLYSDNSVSNRNGTNGTPILYSGADVDLAVKMNIDIDTFGYSLDLINQNEVPAGVTNYKKIVYDESNLVSDWGNTSNKTNLLKSFKTFSTDIFESIDADIILEEKDNGKKYGNFSTSLGKYKEQSGGAKEDGVYQIVMKNGVLVESNPSYQLMLKQLAKDYYGDESKIAQAKSLFLSSGIYQTIRDSVESSISSLNRSQVHPENNYNGKDIHLGNDNHWYDEQVKTFVIRRYRDSARFRDVTLSDKLDYNMGNTSNGRNDATQNSYNNSDCQWYLYLYYNKKHASDYMKNIITDWYDPSKDATRQTAINSSTILVNHLYIPSVDFRIASDTVAN